MINDTSIFEGWKEFKISRTEYKAEDLGGGYWSIFVKQDDESFLRKATVYIDKNQEATCEAIYDAYIDLDD